MRACKLNLDNIAIQYGITNVEWDIRTGNTLEIVDFDNKMDFVVGNPPYVRVHNLGKTYDSVKEYSFAKRGMTDLYIVFFEICLNMLNKNGKLGVITPSSYLYSKAGLELRNFFENKRGLKKFVDFEDYQIFEKTTYSAITIFDNSDESEYIEYYKYDEVNKCVELENQLNYADCFVGKRISFGTHSTSRMLSEIEENWKNRKHRKIIVKNGFATLADKVFIGNFDFEECVIDVIKGSTGKWSKCIFPYTDLGAPISIEEISKHKDIFKYLTASKLVLLNRAIADKKNWHLFGRSQGIHDVFVDKVSINSLIKDISTIKLNYVEAGKGIYSGLYILGGYSFSEIKGAIETEEFIEYLKLLKNYKSNGYFSISSKELEKYLSYKLENNS